MRKLAVGFLTFGGAALVVGAKTFVEILEAPPPSVPPTSLVITNDGGTYHANIPIMRIQGREWGSFRAVNNKGDRSFVTVQFPKWEGHANPKFYYLTDKDADELQRKPEFESLTMTIELDGKPPDFSEFEIVSRIHYKSVFNGWLAPEGKFDFKMP